MVLIYDGSECFDHGGTMGTKKVHICEKTCDHDFLLCVRVEVDETLVLVDVSR